MTAKIIKLIPPDERPYAWATKEMQMFFPKPDVVRLHNLDQRAEKPDTQIALFYKDPYHPVLLRVYWVDTDSFKYSILENFTELYTEHKILVELLMRNAAAAYEYAFQKDPHYVNKLLYGEPKVVIR